MRKWLIAAVFLYGLFSTTSVLWAQSSGFQPSPHIYKIIASECDVGPTQRVQSGFRVANQIGIFTALHGVAGCKTVTAQPGGDGQAFHNLIVGKVDIQRDVALLWSEELNRSPQVGLKTTGQAIIISSNDSYQIIGYPFDVLQQKLTVDVKIPQRTPLGYLLSPAAINTLADRDSPAIDIEVFSIQTHLVPGHSGAPLFNDHEEVIGIGNGGLDLGRVEMGWAIPWDSITLKTVSDKISQNVSLDDIKKLDKLGQADTGLAFAFETSESSVFTLTPTATASKSCSFWLQIIDENLEPIRGAQIRVIYRSESVEGISNTDGEYRGEIPCDVSVPLGNIEATAAGFVPIKKNVRLNTNRIQIQLSVSATPTPTPLPPTLLPLPSLPTATASLMKCPFWFQIVDMNLQPIYGAHVSVIYRLTTAEGFSDSEGHYRGTIACDVQNPLITVEVTLVGHIKATRVINLWDERFLIQLYPLATDTPTATSMPTPSATATDTPTPAVRIGAFVETIPKLRIRSAPGLSNDVVKQVIVPELFVVVDGPVKADSYDWWQLSELNSQIVGWAAYVEDGDDISLKVSEYRTPTPTPLEGVSSSPQSPTARPTSQSILEITDPRPGQSVVGKCEVFWRFAGQLKPGQGFDLILRYAPDRNDREKARGVTGVQEIARKLISHGNGEYSVTVDFAQAPSVKQFGNSSYYLSVTMAQIEPYARIGTESPGVDIHISPESIQGCKKG